MISGACRDARKRQVVLGSDGGDERLRSVAARRRQRVGPSGHGVADQHPEVVAGAKLDRLDASRTRLDVEVRGGCLAAAGSRVPDHDRPCRSLGGRECHVDPEGMSCGDGAEPEQTDGNECLGQDPTGHQHRDGADEQQRSDHHEHRADSSQAGGTPPRR